MATEEFQFEEATHQYKYNGKVIPSVTQVIRAVLGHGWSAAEWYMQRGRAVHACAAFIAQGVDFKSDPQISGQVAAIKKFYAEVKPEVISCEQKMVSMLFRFAGTADLICRIGGKRLLIDFKASLDFERTALQLGGYAILAAESRIPEIKYGRAVVIKADGTYQMSKAINLRQARREFLALRAVYGIMERMNILPRKEEN